MTTWTLQDSLKISRFLTERANGSETKLPVGIVCEEYMQKRKLKISTKGVLQQQFNRVLLGLQDHEHVDFKERLWILHIYDFPIGKTFCNHIFSQYWFQKVTLSENAIAVKVKGSFVKLNFWKWGAVQNEGFDNQPSSRADHDQNDEPSLWDEIGPDIQHWKYLKPSRDTPEYTTWTPQLIEKFMDMIVKRTKTAPLFLTFHVFCSWFKHSEKILEDVDTIKQRMLKIIQKPIDITKKARFHTKIKVCQVMRIPADDDFKIQLLNCGIVSFDDESCILDFTSYDGSLELGDEYVNRIHQFLYEEAAANYQTTITEKKLLQNFLKQRERFKWGAFSDEYLTKKFQEVLVGIRSLDKYGAPGQIRLMISTDPNAKKSPVKEKKCKTIRGYTCKKRTLFRPRETNQDRYQATKEPERKRAKLVKMQEEKPSDSIGQVIELVAKASSLRRVMAPYDFECNEKYTKDGCSPFFNKLKDLVTPKDQKTTAPSCNHDKPNSSVESAKFAKDRSPTPSENWKVVPNPKEHNEKKNIDVDDKTLAAAYSKKLDQPLTQNATSDPTPDEFQDFFTSLAGFSESKPAPSQTTDSIKKLEVRPFPRNFLPQRTEDTVSVHELMQILRVAILTFDSPALSEIMDKAEKVLEDTGSHEKGVFIKRIGNVLSSSIQSICNGRCEVGHCDQPVSLSAALYVLTNIVKKINSAILVSVDDSVLAEKKKYECSGYTVCAETVTQNIQKIFNVFQRHNISSKTLYHTQFDLSNIKFN